jgi:hypothetical protein
MFVIRGAGVEPATAPTRATSGGRPSGGRFVRATFYAVGIAAGLTYFAGRLRVRGAPGDTRSERLSLIEDRLALLELTKQDQLAPVVSTGEARGAQEAYERRLAALERRLTTVERVREARRSLTLAKPNGNANGNGNAHKDRRHG